MPLPYLLWVGGAAVGGYALGMFSDTNKMIKTGVLIGASYYVYKKVK